MTDYTMHMYAVGLTEKAGPKEAFDLLVTAITRDAANEWAKAHAEANNLTLTTPAYDVPDVEAWGKNRRSRDPVAHRRLEAAEKAAAADVAQAAKP